MRATIKIALCLLSLSCGGTSAPTTQTIGASGGQIVVVSDSQLRGTKLVVPAGALSAATLITVERGADSALSDETNRGPAVRLLPDGLTFAQPATLTIPYDPSVPAATLVVGVTADGVRTELFGAALTIDVTGKTVAFSISHFTDYQVIGELCASDDTVDGGATNGSDTCPTSGTTTGTPGNGPGTGPGYGPGYTY